jgi:hypothetical protein
MEYLKKLQVAIEELNDTVDQQALEIIILQNEREAFLRPSAALFEMNAIIIGMLADNTAFIRNKGISDKARAAKEKLLRALELVEQLDVLSASAQRMQMINRNLLFLMQKARVENADLKKQLTAASKIDNF